MSPVLMLIIAVCGIVGGTIGLARWMRNNS
jgi:hypothetical protein